MNSRRSRAAPIAAGYGTRGSGIASPARRSGQAICAAWFRLTAPPRSNSEVVIATFQLSFIRASRRGLVEVCARPSSGKRDKQDWRARKTRELLVRRLDGDIRPPRALQFLNTRALQNARQSSTDNTTNNN
jgi:hypothetical protein